MVLDSDEETTCGINVQPNPSRATPSIGVSGDTPRMSNNVSVICYSRRGE